jgi:hypothetical protein
MLQWKMASVWFLQSQGKTSVDGGTFNSKRDAYPPVTGTVEYK